MAQTPVQLTIKTEGALAIFNRISVAQRELELILPPVLKFTMSERQHNRYIFWLSKEPGGSRNPHKFRKLYKRVKPYGKIRKNRRQIKV